MDAYTGFAAVYDMFMDNIPYEEWCGYLTGLLRAQGIYDGLVLDLGCGTGKLTRLLAAEGYDMIGVDLSGEMLEIAMERQAEQPDGILYLQQDMREFELYGTVRAIVSICDSMNYLTEYEDLVQVLRLANNYLDPGGVFIFDLNTVYKYREELGEQTIAENREEGSFIWENYFDEEEMVNEYDLTLFIREEDGRFRKYEETHYQRAYSLEQIREAVEEAGMELAAVYEAFTEHAPEPDSSRIYVIAREQGKKARASGGGTAEGGKL
ncbi:MAG: class I SAM-dependent methyltransferase [Eubacteriales bacterium]|nr:class I SAM-dependent methyltransferase [Eubacteriales bacterium]